MLAYKAPVCQKTSEAPIFTAANHSTQAVRHLSLPTRRYAFRHFRTCKKYAFHHTIGHATIFSWMFTIACCL